MGLALRREAGQVLRPPRPRPRPVHPQRRQHDGNKNNPLELPEYPRRHPARPQLPEPVYVFGPDYSPDGIIQYHGNAFGGALDGHLLITRYSAGKDVIDLTLNADGSINTGNVHVGSAGMTGLGDPLSLTEAPNGDLFVAEYGTGDIIRLADGAAGIPTPTPTPTPLPRRPRLRRRSVTVPPPTALTAVPLASGIVLNWTRQHRQQRRRLQRLQRPPRRRARSRR